MNEPAIHACITVFLILWYLMAIWYLGVYLTGRTSWELSARCPDILIYELITITITATVICLREYYAHQPPGHGLPCWITVMTFIANTFVIHGFQCIRRLILLLSFEDEGRGSLNFIATAAGRRKVCLAFLAIALLLTPAVAIPGACARDL
jgi:hypothetical protein